jgi:putative Holliday junction resolvase
LKLLALDVGERRIGLASGVADIGTALPAGVLLRMKLASDILAVLDAARIRQVDAIVVGVPYRPGGEESPQTKRILGFIRALRKQTPLAVHIVDEAFTSAEAEALLRDAGLEPSRDKGTVDEAAAVLILRRFLDSQGSIEDGRGAQFTDMSAGSPPTAGS